MKPVRLTAAIAIVGALVAGITPVSAQVIGPNFLLPPCSKLEYAPAVAAQGNVLLASWRGANCAAGATFRVAVSRNGGGTWQDVPPPFIDLVQRPISICAGDSGRFYAAAGVLRLGVGYTMEMFEGRQVGTVFGWRRLANPFPAPFGGGDPAEVQIRFDPVRRNLYVTFSDVTSGVGPDEYRVTFVRSTDGGVTWSTPLALTGRESNGAQPVVGVGGELSVIWQNYVTQKLMGRRSADYGMTFGAEFEVGPILDNVGLVPSAWDGPFTSVNPAYPWAAGMAAPPMFSIAVDRSNGPQRGTWYVVTAEHGTGTIGPLTASRTEVEPNRTFASATEISIGEDVSGGLPDYEFSFDSDVFKFYGEAGRTIWLNGGANYPVELVSMGCWNNALEVTSVGAFNVTAHGPVPGALYTLPSTGWYGLLPGGAIRTAVEYVLSVRDYFIDPNSVSRDHRDLLLTSSSDGGVTWSPKVRVSDGPVGNDQSFPEVVVDGSGRVHVAWYDRRESVECGNVANTYWSYSDDGGQTFHPAAKVSTESSQAENHWTVGQHLGLAASGEKVYVLWARVPAGASSDIYGAVITDFPTAVLISGLRVAEHGGGHELRWRASDVGQVREFRIHRAVGDRAYQVAGLVAPGTDGDYRWQDGDVVAGMRHRYRLEVVRTEGASLWDGPVELTIVAPAIRLAWRGATPNPFADRIELELETPAQGATRVAVYDVTGHEVARLTVEAGGERSVVRWNGRDRTGRPVAPGVYVVRAQLGAQTVVRQIVRMK